MTPRPNVLIFIADQLRADHLGFAGNQEVRTPHLDRLAKVSTQFTNAYVANPTCMPNRASLLTGRWPSAHGTRCNGIALDPDANTFVRQLARDGYRTAAVGKLHHQNMGWDYEGKQLAQIEETSPELLDPHVPDAVERSWEEGWDKWEDRQRHSAEYLPLPDDYYGYQHVDLIIGHGDAPGGHWEHWARQQGVEPRQLGGADASQQVAPSWEQVYTSEIPAAAHPTRFVGDKAIENLERCAQTEDPFFLFVSFPDPHHPFAPPKEYADRYDPAQLSLPETFHDDPQQVPAHIRAMLDRRGVPDEDPTMTFAVTEEQYSAALAAQYGLIEFMDEQIGRVLQHLEDSGQAENTIILFTSDHGDLFGDHGLMLKHFVHYTAVTNVPLLVHLPGQHSSHASDDLVSTTDIAPTILELTQAPSYRGIQGQSLVPLLETGTIEPGRAALLIEEDQPFSPEGLPAPARIRTVVSQQGRLTRYYGTDELEVYDHAVDPHERVNIASWADPTKTQRELERHLADELMRLAETGRAPTSSA
ncbi:sulfatase family protein [Micrococcoides hystricis]|uniref:Sulfatase n=1 Tax=Micrococcoides hystricis TaxID=1572761 RepID=A0ABV6PAT1_9MICC